MTEIKFSIAEWLMPVLITGSIILILFFFLTVYVANTKSVVRYGFILKYLAVALLLVCLLDPQQITRTPVKGETAFVLMADNSRSMSRKHKSDSKSSSEYVKEALKSGETAWIHKLGEEFDLQSFYFDHRLRQKKDLTELKFDGSKTELNNHLTEISERFPKDKTGGVLLLTDGILTDRDKAVDPESLPPIYPVIPGNYVERKDIWINDLTASVSSFEDAPVSIRVEVSSRGYEEKEIAVELLNENNVLVDSKTFRSDGTVKTFRFQPEGGEAGVRFFKARVYEKGAEKQFKDNETAELTLKNNTRAVKVDRRGGPYRVLYVSGRPNWEYKYLARSVQKDKQIQLSALIRIAKKEEKFKFREGGRNNASVNPLFQGLDKDKAEAAAASFDEPVFMRLNTNDSKELESGFPSNREELFKFHALIIDDCEASFFTADQLTLIRDFVSERGGGLLMLSGMDSLREGKYDKTVLKDILPVYLTANSSFIEGNNKYRLSITREGWLQPWVRLFDNEDEEKKRVSQMVDFKVLNRVDRIKPGALNLASVKDPTGNEYPALIAHRYGLGRCSVFCIGDFWRWGLKGKSEKVNMEKSWRQMVRWLTADVSEFMELRVETPKNPDEPVKIEFFPHDKDYNLIEDGTPVIEITDDKGETVSKPMKLDENESGRYYYDYYPANKGLFKVHASLGSEEFPEKGAQSNAFNYEVEDPENSLFTPDIEYLKNLADKTGGKLLTLNDLRDFASDIPRDSFKVTEEKAEAVWNQAWIFLLIISLLASEWWLRRKKGLP